jgi:site-specific DNA recombinase
MKAAIYLRVSSEEQERNYSLRTQEADLRAYCVERGYTVVDVYREVMTGVDLEGRPELSQLRADMAAGKFTVAAVWHSDRLSRDQDDRVYLRVEAERCGGRYESVRDPLGNSDEDRLVDYVRGFAAKLEWRRIRERSVANVRARVDSGKLITAKTPRYGYAFDDPSPKAKGGYVEDPETAWVVRLIFERIAAGTPKWTLGRYLDGQGIPTPQKG